MIRNLCEAFYREQLNLLTPYIDGSQIYGMDDATATSLRTFSNGRLASITSDSSPTSDQSFTILFVVKVC